MYMDPDAVLLERERQRMMQNRRMSTVDQAMRAEMWRTKPGSFVVLRPRIRNAVFFLAETGCASSEIAAGWTLER